MCDVSIYMMKGHEILQRILIIV